MARGCCCDYVLRLHYVRWLQVWRTVAYRILRCLCHRNRIPWFLVSIVIASEISQIKHKTQNKRWERLTFYFKMFYDMTFTSSWMQILTFYQNLLWYCFKFIITFWRHVLRGIQCTHNNTWKTPKHYLGFNLEFDCVIKIHMSIMKTFLYKKKHTSTPACVRLRSGICRGCILQASGCMFRWFRCLSTFFYRSTWESSHLSTNLSQQSI